MSIILCHCERPARGLPSFQGRDRDGRSVKNYNPAIERLNQPASNPFPSAPCLLPFAFCLLPFPSALSYTLIAPAPLQRDLLAEEFP